MKLLPDVPSSQRLFRVGSLWFLDAEHAEVGAAGERTCGNHVARPAALAAGTHRGVSSGNGVDAHGPARARAANLRRGAPCGGLAASVLVCARLDAPRATGCRYATAGLRTARFRLCGRAPCRGGVAEPLVQRVRNGTLLEISRRRAEELASMENLENAGLNPAVDTEGLPWDMADTSPEDARLFPGKGYAGALEVNTPARWLALRPKLEADGFVLEYAPSFPFEVLEGPVRWYGQAHEDDADRAFDLEIGIEIEGKRVNLLPAVAQALAEHQLSLSPSPGEAEDSVWYAPVDERRRVPVRLKELRGLLAPLAEYSREAAPATALAARAGGTSRGTGASAAQWRLVRGHRERLRGFTKRLREAAERASDVVPASLRAELRPYQRDGLRWMNALAEAGTGWRARGRHGPGQDPAAHHPPAGASRKAEGSLRPPWWWCRPASFPTGYPRSRVSRRNSRSWPCTGPATRRDLHAHRRA